MDQIVEAFVSIEGAEAMRRSLRAKLGAGAQTGPGMKLGADGLHENTFMINP